jgi:hypothetical protein
LGVWLTHANLFWKKRKCSRGFSAERKGLSKTLVTSKPKRRHNNYQPDNKTIDL